MPHYGIALPSFSILGSHLMEHFTPIEDFDFDEHDLDHGLGFDYKSQLDAARALSFRQEHTDSQLESDIVEADQVAKNSGGEASHHAVDQYIELVHGSIYQSAAHSMAAVGMLAPLFESIFKSAFRCMEKEWPRNDLAINIMRAINEESLGLSEHMPENLDSTLDALFQYRNKMFHNGFEWPVHERRAFAKSLSKWPDGWFDSSTSGDEPWMFYMTTQFISHSIDTAENVLLGLIRFQLGPGHEIWKEVENLEY